MSYRQTEKFHVLCHAINLHSRRSVTYWPCYPAQKALLKQQLELQKLRAGCSCAGSLFAKDKLWVCIATLRKTHAPLPSKVLYFLKKINQFRFVVQSGYSASRFCMRTVVRKQLHKSAGCHSQTRLPPLHNHLYSTKFQNTPSRVRRWILQTWT